MSSEDIHFPHEEFHTDLLSERSYVDRRNLLATAAVSLVIAKTGLLPSKIEALGIEFSSVQQQAMLTILTAFLAYFLATFVVHAIADYYAWRKRQEVASLSAIGKRMGMQRERLSNPAESGGLPGLIGKLDERLREREHERYQGFLDEMIAARKRGPKKAYGFSIAMRGGFDLVLPLLLSFIALIEILAASP